ncbi:GGDEF domain-containing protein [Weissella ceti]|uniref:GGDEF domain-containing protein n=1 Tax=Weissella ceti TaxID=759620 RepID=A0ABT3E6X8_9LACO|nr:GGDEF domain-containing protein [Weissella ceti]MCW0953683.1 GGDEF domain-containing protein [Weissella ceti]QVK12237.1 GGDEF domain-containing protein [Weissella ceti]
MADLLDEFLSFSLVTFLVLSTIFSLVFITKLSKKIPKNTRRWLMYLLYFGFTYLIVSLTHATVGIVMLAYVPALVVIMFDDFKIAVVVSLIKPIITLMFLTLIAPGEIRDLTLSFEISWITLMLLLWIFRRVGHHIWVYYAAAIILAVLEDELGLLGPSNSSLVVVVSIATYILVVSFMLYLQKHLIADEQAYLAELNTDPLTGLFNLRAFKQDVENRYVNKEYVILIMDVDKFKMLNDTLGHPTGNLILQRVANKTKEMLAMNFSDMDFKVYRFGGEELVCVIENRGSMCRLSAEIKFLFNQLNEDLMHDMQAEYKVDVTFSGGLSSSIWNDSDADETFKQADRLLYQAKRAGGHKIAIDEHVLTCEKCNNIGDSVFD